MTTRLHTIRGRMLAPDPERPTLRLLDDAVLELDEAGRITTVRAPLDTDAPETWPGAVILPGFIDVHLHYPQTRVIGSASGPLLPWLERSVFPEEARFADLVGKEASVFRGRVGEQVAHPDVTLVDDGTVSREWGTFAIDDEGDGVP